MRLGVTMSLGIYVFPDHTAQTLKYGVLAKFFIIIEES